MKRVLLTVALCVAASVSFAQKKAVNTDMYGMLMEEKS